MFSNYAFDEKKREMVFFFFLVEKRLPNLIEKSDNNLMTGLRSFGVKRAANRLELV